MGWPTWSPTSNPSVSPSSSPTSHSPTRSPSQTPTDDPTRSPSMAPTSCDDIMENYENLSLQYSSLQEDCTETQDSLSTLQDECQYGVTCARCDELAFGGVAPSDYAALATDDNVQQVD